MSLQWHEIKDIAEAFGFSLSERSDYIVLNSYGVNFWIFLEREIWRAHSFTPIFPYFNTAASFHTVQDLYGLCCYIQSFVCKDMKLAWGYDINDCEHQCLTFPAIACAYRDKTDSFSIRHYPLWDINPSVKNDVGGFLYFTSKEKALLFAEHLISFYPRKHIRKIQEIARTNQDLSYGNFVLHGVRLDDVGEYSL